MNKIIPLMIFVIFLFSNEIGHTKSIQLKRYSLGGNFVLTDHHGRSFNLRNHRGKVILLYFGYTGCPTACPTSFSKFTQLYQKLNVTPKKLLILFVTIDPNRDTVNKLKDYINYYDSRFIGLTGTESQVARAAKKYGARYEKSNSDTAMGYTMNHTVNYYLIDKYGRLRYIFNHSATANDMANGIEQLF